MGAIHEEDEPGGCDMDKHPCAMCVLLLALFGALFTFTSYTVELPEYLPDFWVKLPAVEGLERASTGASRAPTFSITLRVANGASEPWHFSANKNGTGRVVVAYQGVPLAHADLPEFSVPGGIISSVPIVATSEGLGMPDELYDRMQIQRRRKERVKLAVHVTLDGVLLWCTAILHGQPQGPFVCPKLYGPTFSRTDPKQLNYVL
ncbi:unnamed protein product [Alopecurus aequalis]